MSLQIATGHKQNSGVLLPGGSPVALTSFVFFSQTFPGRVFWLSFWSAWLQRTCFRGAFCSSSPKVSSRFSNHLLRMLDRTFSVVVVEEKQVCLVDFADWLKATTRIIDAYFITFFWWVIPLVFFFFFLGSAASSSSSCPASPWLSSTSSSSPP